MDITDTIDADYTAKETNEDTHADTDPDSGVTNVTTEKPFYQNLLKHNQTVELQLICVKREKRYVKQKASVCTNF